MMSRTTKSKARIEDSARLLIEPPGRLNGLGLSMQRIVLNSGITIAGADMDNLDKYRELEEEGLARIKVNKQGHRRITATALGKAAIAEANKIIKRESKLRISHAGGFGFS
jgi:hypothetical protein